MAFLGEPSSGTDLRETKVPQLVAGLTSTWVLGVITVGLRVLVQKLTKNKLWLDDWLIIASLAMGLFVAEYMYTLSIVFIKWSILAFYWRIFSTNPTTRLPMWILYSIIGAWGIAVVHLVTSFQRLPISAFWERFDPVNPMPASEYTCGVDVHTFFKANAIPNIATDVFILLLPLPYIWTLHLCWAQKVAVTNIFIVGLFVTVVSVVRLTFVLALDIASPDVTWNGSDEMMWTGIEVNVATVLLTSIPACLPSLKPILNFMMHGNVNPKSHSSGPQGHSDIVTIRSTPAKAEKRWGAAGLNNSNHFASSSHIKTWGFRIIDDLYQFAHLTDNQLEAIELGSIEENGSDAGDTDS
ncbi:hypothetical protein COCVIDRAFT_42865 [Bipolaris victoriae FI3]|uniref:Rhodopsin domain-containing protein n=1 Tax=Bipolaris victoriae (strain FI3) TaxID=930091 RepID=W7E238_BIPV3|nr:hypothetical protein COCVIDRAFT_42865 [Bipolaris victoriae FI3]